jgi:hypothetical protein
MPMLLSDFFKRYLLYNERQSSESDVIQVSHIYMAKDVSSMVYLMDASATVIISAESCLSFLFKISSRKGIGISRT